MRYIINFTSSNASDDSRLSTYIGIDADSPASARQKFSETHPGKEIIRVIECTDDNRSLFGAGAWTEEERDAHRAMLDEKYARERESAQFAREEVSTYEMGEFAALIRYAERRAHEITPNAEGIHIGDLFSCSWGYEQTNVDFYQVVDLKGAHTIVVMRIGTRSREVAGTMTGYTRPIRDCILNGNTYTLRTRVLRGQLHIKAPVGAGYLRPVQDGVIMDYSTYA